MFKKILLKTLKVISIILAILLLLWATFFTINKLTGFCIKTFISEKYHEVFVAEEAKYTADDAKVLDRIKDFGKDTNKTVLIFNNNLCVGTEEVVTEMLAQKSIQEQDEYTFVIIGKTKKYNGEELGKHLYGMFDSSNFICNYFDVYDKNTDAPALAILVVNHDLAIERAIEYEDGFPAATLLNNLGLDLDSK